MLTVSLYKKQICLKMLNVNMLIPPWLAVCTDTGEVYFYADIFSAYLISITFNALGKTVATHN